MAKETPRQQAIVGRVMHEYKEGSLASAGRKVTNPRQAIAIGLSEAGASRDASPARNRRARQHTEQQETKTSLLLEAKARRVKGRGRMTMPELRAALGK